jgi:iron complex transport system substrate-binding protein
VKKSLFAILLILFLGACKREEPPRQEAVRPERIISLGPAITQKLYLLGAGERLIANTVYCDKPDDAKKKTRIGNVTLVNIEKIVSLKPDLVIATGLSQPRQVKKLKDLGIRVVSFPDPHSFSMMCQEFIKLGELVGEKDKAIEIVKQAKHGVERIRRKTVDIQRTRVFVQIGAKPLFTVTKDSFVNDFIEIAGGENIAKHETSGIYSREKVIKEDPQVIVIATMGIAGEKEKTAWRNHQTISAVANDAIYIIDSYKICSPTPPSFVETLEEFVEILHSDLVRK